MGSKRARNEETTEEDELVAKILGQEVDEEKEEGKYTPLIINANAITLSDQVQLILRFYGEPEEIHSNYDFIHCTSYWKSWDDELVITKESLESLITKELRYVGSKYPLCSLFRIRKFVQRGWQVNAGQILKAAIQLGQMNLLDAEVLEDQLIGVDSAYFTQLVRQLKQEDSPKLTPAYLLT